jgi:hypothetical protein
MCDKASCGLRMASGVLKPFTGVTLPRVPPRRRRWRRRVPRALVLLLVVGALQSLAWDLALPAFQGPDEYWQFSYLQHLAETGTLQSPERGNSTNSSEVQQALVQLNLGALMGNLTARPAWSAPDLQLWRRAERALGPGSRANGTGPNRIAKNPPLYYAAMSIPYRLFVWLGLLRRLFVLRLLNALCYLATIALSWALAGELFGPVRWKQALTAGVVALQPQLAFMSAVINADNLLVALTTAFLLAVLQLLRRGPSLGRVLLASALAAGATLTHGRGLVTLPVLLVGLLLAWVVHRPPTRQALARAAASAGVIGGAFLAYVAFGRSGAGVGGGATYGGQVRELNSGSFNLGQFLSSIYQFYLPRLPSLHPRIGPEYGYRQVFIDTFYGTFGSLEVVFKQRVYDALQVLSAIGLVGLYTACVARRRALASAWPSVAAMLALLLTLLLFLHYASYRALVANGGTDPLIVGRYLLPVVSLFGLAIAFTVSALPRRLGPLVGGAILALGALLSLAGIGMTAARFYA